MVGVFVSLATETRRLDDSSIAVGIDGGPDDSPVTDTVEATILEEVRWDVGPLWLNDVLAYRPVVTGRSDVDGAFA